MYAMPYPFYWQALWPLIGVALAQDRPADAILYARQLCDPSQQILPWNIEEPLAAAVAAWDAGQPDEARQPPPSRPRSGAADEFLLIFLLVKRSVKRS